MVVLIPFVNRVVAVSWEYISVQFASGLSGRDCKIKKGRAAFKIGVLRLKCRVAETGPKITVERLIHYGPDC